MNYEVIVIGAGASGLTAAIAAARQGSSVLVIERKEKAGKKIMATGNGKCNFTNMLQKPECYRSEDNEFVMKVLSQFDLNATLEFFKELGIYPKSRDGYLYPNSEQASSVVEVLLMECERLKITIHYKETVKAIIKPDYTIMTEREEISEQTNNTKGKSSKSSNLKKADTNINKLKLTEGMATSTIEKAYHAKKVIIAAGGCASPQLGSDGSGYDLAKSLGHTIIKPLPALVQLKSPDKYLKTLSGVRVSAKVAAFSDRKLLSEEAGEILFTDYGISGIPILQLSRYVAKAIDHKEQVHLILDFMPELSCTELAEVLRLRIKQNSEKNLEELFIGFLNHKLSYIIIKEAELNVYQKGKLMKEPELKKLIQGIKSFVMKISGTNSFENAQVSAGGIATKELQAFNLESKLRKGIYFVGELVDVDGTCGGYNLQWAWSSGYLAGAAAGRNDPKSM